MSTQTEASTTQALATAKTISEQLAFWTKAELGVKKQTALRAKMGGLELELTGMSITRGKRVRIVLDYSDTYEIEVFKLGRKGTKNWGKKLDVVTASDVHAAELGQVVRELVFGDLA